ncbi:(R)-citramalate synthase CimA [Sulfuracidifex tepidarius]|uniref:Citramalate synthase n=1 Tax=Sulfuracidifex tepidarius TaxID=1294262 RepID=A0A510E5Q2_9CREN|nr:citramalate synthase [Sulfuracidifex tepidarius]BBG24590.1 (R)-citramalate synthase CimA [Sulfuracidifex tepidarius]BBG27378.1 (R)-citramalate synthase CimA [Sulfuracidifex tepidarius]
MFKKSVVEVLDTTLRDGSQTANIGFTLKDKIRIAQELDQLGIDYIEGGWPGSNPKDKEFFMKMKDISLSRAKIAAFGSTRRKGIRPEDDVSLNSILEADVDVAVLFGKSWDLHVRDVIKSSLEENLEIVYDSIHYLKEHGLKVIFDAEHFYQGYKDNREYAMNVLRNAEKGGADVIVLADTNGGTTPIEVFEVTKNVRENISSRLGVHMHNDIGCAVANSLLALSAGATHVQGTVNGLGERTGNADLIQILPTIYYKMKMMVLNGEESMKKLKQVSKLVYELAGINPNPYQPYVGENAFTHKAGVHVDAVIKVPRAYEHLDPTLVGNNRKFVISELSGTSNLLTYLKNIGIEIDKKDPKLKKALELIKEKENMGYSFDIAPSSAVLIAMKALGIYYPFIKLDYWKVIGENSGMSIAVVKVNSNLEVSEGVGPVHALDKAIRSALVKVFPEIASIRLTDYRVILPGEVKNTESLVRVTIEFSDGTNMWKTEGVSTNVIEASVIALIDGLDYYLQVNKKIKGALSSLEV